MTKLRKQSLGSEIYSGAAVFGKVRAIIGVFIGTLISIFLIGFGIYAIARRKKRTHQLVGTIQKLEDGLNICVPTSVDNKIMYDCHFKVDYKIGIKEYSHTFQTRSNTTYTDGGSIDLYYDPKNIGDIALTPDDTHLGGWIALIVGIVMLVGVWLMLYFTLKYKVVAAASGVAGAADMLFHR